MKWSQAPPPDGEEPVIHAAISEIIHSIGRLMEDGFLDRQTHQLLETQLHRSQTGLFEADAAEALAGIGGFAEAAERLVGERRSHREPIEPMVDRALAVEHDIIRLVRTPPHRLIERIPRDLVMGPFSTYALVLHVAKAAPSGGDGSAGRPYATLAGALSDARRRAAQGVEIRVDELGPYPEDVEVTRDTRIVGTANAYAPRIEGRIVNHGPFILDLERLDVAPSEGTALLVRNPGAATGIRDVEVNGGSGFGLLQAGGVLYAHGLTVWRVRPAPAQRGMALQLEAGAKARVQDVLLHRNEGGALLARDAETEVSADRLTIRSTKASDGALDGRGAMGLEVGDGARFEGTWINILDNEFVGVKADGGARVRLRYAQVRNTTGVNRPDRSGRTGGPDAPGGLGVLAHDGGHVVLSGFTVKRSDLCGISIATDGEVDLHDGVVGENAIGACVRVPGYAIGRLTSGVRYVDNQVAMETVDIPVPDFEDPTDW